MVFGGLAQILALYQAWVPGSDHGPQQGGDSIQLVRRGEQ